MEPGILEENSEKIHQEETAAVMNKQQSDLLGVRNRCLRPSLSSGYGSEEDDLTDKIPDSDDFRMSLRTNGNDVAPHYMKDLSLGEEGTVDLNDLKQELKNLSLEGKSEISAEEQPLPGIEELFELPEWISEVPGLKYPVDRNCSKDEVLSSIPASDLRKLDNITLEFDPLINNISEENFDRTEDVKTLFAGLDSGPNVNELMNKNCDTLENKIHCHRVSMEKIVADILQMTKETEDPIEDSKMTAAFDEVLGFHQEVKLPDDPSLKSIFPDKNICNSEECPSGVRKSSETPSEFLNKVNSSVQFFHGFCSAYQAPARPHYVPQKSRVAHVGTSHCGAWYNSTGCQSSEHSFHPLEPSYNSLSTELNPPNFFKTELCCSKPQEKSSEPKFQLWPNEEPKLSGLRARPSSESQAEKLLETSYRNYYSPDFVATCSPVEDFFNSLYLPDDLLPSEITSSATANKRRASVDNLFSDYHVNAMRPSSSDDRMDAMRSSSSVCSLVTNSKNDQTEKVNTNEVYNADIWGDEKETFWKPLPTCPVASSESNGQRLSHVDNSRRRKDRFAPFSTTRHSSKTRGWPGSYPRKYYS